MRPLAAQATAQDSGFRATVADARAALASGSPYGASRLLVPVLGTRLGQEPEVVLLAARAAAGWQGWGTVQQLLFGVPWLDRLAGGEGRALLARARLERSELAIGDAERALALATPPTVGERLVLLARAYDRGEQRDSAARVYLRAAIELPGIAEWLLLRSAGVTRDSAERAALYKRLTRPAVTGRIGWTEALARSRAGDHAGAARAYSALGAHVAALRMRTREARTDSARAAVRRDLVALIVSGTAVEARDATVLLDSAFAPLTAREDLRVARRAAASELARAAIGFAHAASARLLTEADRLTQATVQARLGAHREAMRLLSLIRSPELTVQAEYQRARSLLSLGNRPESIRVLREITARAVRPGDSADVAMAGFLTGDLLEDLGNDSAARRSYLDVARRFPGTPHGPRASFQAAMLAWATGDHRQAGIEFSELADRAGEHRETAAALYWSGRAALEQGDSSGARARWNAVQRRFPGSYYAIRAADRLGVPAAPAAGPLPPGFPDSTLATAFERAALLERLGLRVEAGFEYDRMVRAATASPPSARLSTAAALLERGQTGRAYRLALDAIDSLTRRLAFPLAEIPFLMDETARAGVDPLVAAALMRQESGFDVTARSRVNAMGLMQVMPSLGQALARPTGIREWETALLHQPEINLRFGLSHLTEMLRQHPELHHALAAYNAGSRAANFWRTLPGAATDPEVYIERIQYVETRDYVRAVLRNLAVYRAQYPRTQ